MDSQTTGTGLRDMLDDVIDSVARLDRIHSHLHAMDTDDGLDDEPPLPRDADR